MASDLSSSCTEVNELFNDEKEEGEISLEDVSSSEDGQPYKYPPRAFGQCPYCLSTQHCATWCKSLTINKNNIKREAHPVVAEDAALQGKENRSRRRYHKDNADVRASADSGGPKSTSSYTTLQEKNKDDDTTVINDLVPISSDSDMELVGLGYETKSEKRSRQPLKSNKTRRRRRNKSPSVASLSLSPSSIDLTLSVKESIHRLEPKSLVSNKKESNHSKCYRRSPKESKKKLINIKPSLSIHRHNRSRSSPTFAKRRTGRQAPPPSSRKFSPPRQREIETSLNPAGDSQQPSMRGNVTKLLKKVRRLEPFSSRSREKRSSLKDKLSNIIKNKKETTTAVTGVTTAGTNITATATNTNSNITNITTSTCTEETNKENSTKPTTKEEPEISVKPKEEAVAHRDKEIPRKEKDDDEDLLVLRQIALETKQKKTVALKTEDTKSENIDTVQTQSEATAFLQKLPKMCIDDNDDDLELRMIALRSAVLKKHHTRLQSGIKRKKKSETPVVPRIESPFTSSFIEDFPLLAKICSPTSPLGSKKDTYYDEDMDLDSDMELDGSPYSPSDDVGNHLVLEGIETSCAPTSQEHAVTLCLYSSSNPIETPCHRDQSIDPSVSNTLEFTNHESRPYSPTDATIYDPDLPGLCFSSAKALPLQPPPLPPLPPLGMLGPQQPILLDCTISSPNVYTDPLLTLPMPGFSTIHQTLNPLLIPPPPPPPPSTAPLFTCPETTTVTTMNSATESTTAIFKPMSTSELDDFGETDLDGSPLVPIEHDSERTTWSLLDEPLYLHNVQNSESSGLSTLIRHIPRSEPQSQVIETISKNMKPQDGTIVEPIILQSQHKNEPEVLKAKKLPSTERKRKQKQSNVSRPVKESISSKLNTPREKSPEFSNRNLKEKKSKGRDTNVEDDEETLREILLASLAKRTRDQPMEISPTKVESKNAPKSKDDLLPITASPLKLIFAKSVTTNQLKRPVVQATSTEQPLRKIMKKSNVIPASTKVVNNAKRYQNLLIQRKLNQQKISLIALSKNRFKINNNSNNNRINKSAGNVSEIQRSASPQITKSITENQRIIINLNEDTESESEVEETKAKLDLGKARPTLTIPTTDFEKSVDQFLKSVRHQQEMTVIVTTTSTSSTITKMMTTSPSASQPKISTQQLVPVTSAVSATKIANPIATKPSILLTKPTTAVVVPAAITPDTSLGNEKFVVCKPKSVKPAMKIPSISATPQAVKHLPVSQQEEYRRLKQQIFEREKLRLQKSPGSTPVCSAITSLAKRTSTLSSPILLSSTPASSTPIVVPRTRMQGSNSPVSPLRKIIPKTQLVATISPMSKQISRNATGKTTIPVTPITSKQIISRANVVSKVPIQSSPRSTVTRLQQAKLLDKMNDALNTQKKHIRAVAHKMSSLRILTKEQLSLKSSQIQRAIAESENRIFKDNHQPKDMRDECKVISNPVNSNSLPACRSSVEQTPIMENLSTVDKSKQNWEDFKKIVNEEMKSLSNLCTEEKKELLAKTEEELITKRHSVLDNITEMSGNLRQWEIEKDLQNMLNNEINKLREQLKIAEEKLQQQKEKLNTILPKVSIYHEKINSGRKECFRLSKICNRLGQQIIGSNYNVPTAGAELLNNKIKEVATHTQKLRSKKSQPKEIIKSNHFTKSDKTKTKNNIHSKRKEFLKKQQSINATKYNESLTKTNNKNNNSNLVNINTETKNQLLETSVKNTSFITTNANYTRNKNSLTEVNLEKSLTNTNVLNAVLNTENIFNQEIKNQLSEYNSDLTAILKTETEKPLKIGLINSILIEKNAIDISNNKVSTQSNILNKIVNRDNLQLEIERNLTECNITNRALVSNCTNNTETDKPLTKFNETISPLIKKDIIDSKIENELIETNIENSIVSKENIFNIENENALMMNSAVDKTLIMKNINSNCEKLLSDFSAKKLVLNQESILDIESEKSPTGISVDNLIHSKRNIENNFKNSLNETSVTKNYLITENNLKAEPKDTLNIGIKDSISSTVSIIDAESNESLSDTEQKIPRNHSELMVMTASLNTENIENNSNINNDKNIKNSKLSVLNLEEIINNKTKTNNYKTHQTKASESSTSAEHSTLLDEISLELKNPIQEISEKIHKSELVTKDKNIEQLSDQINMSDSLLQGCSYKASRKNVVQPYESILKHLHVIRNNKTDGILCPFELMGTCNDGDCQFIHQSTSHCQ